MFIADSRMDSGLSMPVKSCLCDLADILDFTENVALQSKRSTKRLRHECNTYSILFTLSASLRPVYSVTPSLMFYVSRCICKAYMHQSILCYRPPNLMIIKRLLFHDSWPTRRRHLWGAGLGSLGATASLTPNHKAVTVQCSCLWHLSQRQITKRAALQRGQDLACIHHSC